MGSAGLRPLLAMMMSLFVWGGGVGVEEMKMPWFRVNGALLAATYPNVFLEVVCCTLEPCWLAKTPFITSVSLFLCQIVVKDYCVSSQVCLS